LNQDGNEADYDLVDATGEKAADLLDRIAPQQPMSEESGE
jgi:hypothetical protein